MPQTDLTGALRALSAAHLDVPPDALRADAELGDDLGVDSLAAIEWAMAIEDAFGVTMPDDAWGETVTYGAVEDLVLRLAGGRA